MEFGSPKKGLLERLAEGVVLGDGGFVFELERRGYVTAGPWTPEVTVEDPDAVRQLHKEFLRAGADVAQAFTFYASEDKVEDAKNKVKYKTAEVNQAACDIAREVTSGSDALVAAGISQLPSYFDGKGKDVVQSEFRKQVSIFTKANVDFLICETISEIEQMEWAIEVCRESGRPVAANMTIGPQGDVRGVPVGQCAVRMVKAGADVVGVNCGFDPDHCLQTVRLMKDSLNQAGLNPYLMTQPNGFLMPEGPRGGWIDVPEFPFALEPRGITRWDAQRYAREAYELGVRYIGGCCGFEAYHIRALAEELKEERKSLPPASAKHPPWGEAMSLSLYKRIASRVGKEYWSNLQPATGRIHSPAVAVMPAEGEITSEKK